MKNRRELIPAAQSAAGKKEYPPLMESELEELASDLDPSQRRGMAARLERWVQQLRYSADVIEAAELSQEVTPEPVCLPVNLAERTKGLTRSEFLELAATLTDEADQIREALGVSVSDPRLALLPMCATQN
jgi:hypothetical protein